MRIEHRAGKLAAIALFTATCLAIFGWLWVKAGGDLPGGRSGTQAQALLPTAFQLVPNADVRRAGVKIGRVRDVEHRGALGLVRFEVDADQGPLYRDARVRIRTKTLVGENYLELDPGDARAGRLPRDGVLSVEQAGEAVQLDEILSGLDARTRAAVQRNLSSIGRGVGDRGPQLNRLFGELPGVVGRVTELDDVLRGQRPQLARLVAQTGELTQAFADRGEDVRTLAVGAEATARAAAERDAQLGAALDELPATLRQVGATTRRVGALGRRNAPVVADLRTGVDALPAVTRRLERSARAGRTVVGVLPGLARRADPMIRRLQAFAPAAAALVAPLDELLRQVNPALRYLAPYAREAGTVFANLGSAADTTDAVGHLGRVMPIVGTRSVTGLPPGVHDALDRLTALGGLVPAMTLGVSPYPEPGQRANPVPLRGAPPRVDADPPATTGGGR